MRRLLPFFLLPMLLCLAGCKKSDSAAMAQQAVIELLDRNIDSLRMLVRQARDEGKRWKTDRWRTTLARFEYADTPIISHLDVLRREAETLPYRPEQIKTWLDQLADRRMEIARVKNELSVVARKTKNGKAAIGAPSAATKSAKGASRR